MKLWEPYDIPIVCIAGEPGSGKTLWGLTVDPACLTWDHEPTTFIWDAEGSSIPYVGNFNFKRFDISKEIYDRKLGDDATAAYTLWRDSLKAIPKGKYRVGIIDTVNEIEDGLSRWVKGNPGKFGYTANQFAKMEGLMWGAMKSEWKKLLMIASQKFETLVLTTHMRDEFKGSRPTNRRTPRGKESIIQVASIYMTIARKVQSGSGTAPTFPSGLCSWPGGKVRLLRVDKNTGNLEPILPPHLIDASPNGIRKYLSQPADFSRLKKSEQALPDKSLTEDERLAMKAEIASAELSKLQVEQELRNDVSKESSTSDFIAPHLRVSSLKDYLLSKLTISEAKQLLKNRYNVTLFVQLNKEQLHDLSLHLDSLPN